MQRGDTGLFRSRHWLILGICDGPVQRFDGRKYYAADQEHRECDRRRACELFSREYNSDEFSVMTGSLISLTAGQTARVQVLQTNASAVPLTTTAPPNS